MSAVEEVKAKIAAKEYDPKDLPLFMKALQEIAETSDELKEELSSWEDTTIVLKVPGITSAYLKVTGGKLEVGEGELENPDLTIEMTEEVARGIASQEVDMASAYMAGDIKLEGDISIGMKLRPLMEIVGEKLGVPIGQ
jgi:putative sterol carrier protein